MFPAVSILAFVVLGSVLEGVPAIVLFGPLLFPIARQLGIHEVHYSVVVILHGARTFRAASRGRLSAVSTRTRGCARSSADRTVDRYRHYRSNTVAFDRIPVAFVERRSGSRIRVRSDKGKSSFIPAHGPFFMPLASLCFSEGLVVR